jgi:large subunit ribosomal protein L24
MRNKLRLKKGDEVIVIAGKDKGKRGEIKAVYRKTRRVLVDGINLKTKHKKKDTETQEGGIVKIEASVDISNVMYYCESAQAGSKIGYKIKDDGMKVRFCKKTGEEIEEKVR